MSGVAGSPAIVRKAVDELVEGGQVVKLVVGSKVGTGAVQPQLNGVGRLPPQGVKLAGARAYGPTTMEVMATTPRKAARPTQPGGLRVLKREHERLDALDLFSRVDKQARMPIGTAERIDPAVASIRSGIVEATSNPSTLHGWRVQSLFENLVASLGKVALLKQEDAGDVYYAGKEVKVPDFRIATSDKRQILVEVKNFYNKNPTANYRMPGKYYDELLRYADLVGGLELKVAIYWTPWNLWTLIDIERMIAKGPKREISLHEASKANEMAVVGDLMVGTEWPLALTFYNDPGISRLVDADGTFVLKVQKAEYSAGGAVATKPVEVRIIHTLMLYGGWEEETTADIQNGEAISVTFSMAPEVEPPKDQNFAFHGMLSSIFSRIFNQATLAEDGTVETLRPKVEPNTLGRLIPYPYNGETLKLWLMTLQPS